MIEIGAGASSTIADLLKGANQSTIQGKTRDTPLLSRDPYSPPPPECSGAYPRVTQEDMAEGFKNIILPLFFVFLKGESHVDRSMLSEEQVDDLLQIIVETESQKLLGNGTLSIGLPEFASWMKRSK